VLVGPKNVIWRASTQNQVEEQTANETRGRLTGHSDNLIDARASSFCFLRNRQPGPHGSCIRRSSAWTRAPKGAPGRVLFVGALWRGPQERPRFSALFLFWGRAMSACLAFDSHRLRHAILLVVVAFIFAPSFWGDVGRRPAATSRSPTTFPNVFPTPELRTIDRSPFVCPLEDGRF